MPTLETGFTADSRHLESSIIAAHSFGLMFVEGQFGSVSATDVNFKNWSGVRSQLRLGIDTPFGAPFVQLTHRDFGHTADTAGYVGFEIANTEIKTDTYAFSTSLHKDWSPFGSWINRFHRLDSGAQPKQRCGVHH
jgi:hypothetical protein